MKERITLCGDNCALCPRFNAHSDKELRAVAELWYKIGFRESVASNEDIACSGCSSDKSCTYKMLECATKHSVNKCNQCADFPCGKISEMLKLSAENQKRCRKICSKEEYEILKKAFFEKEQNLTNK